MAFFFNGYAFQSQRQRQIVNVILGVNLAFPTRRARSNVNDAHSRQRDQLITGGITAHGLIGRFSSSQRTGHNVRMAFQGIRARAFYRRARAGRWRRTRARRRRHKILIGRSHRQFQYRRRGHRHGRCHHRRRQRVIGRPCYDGCHVRQRSNIGSSGLYSSRPRANMTFAITKVVVTIFRPFVRFNYYFRRRRCPPRRRGRITSKRKRVRSNG